MERTGAVAYKSRPLRDLSGGQQQRTHLAQVLARRADVLLLDEPTAGLDLLGRQAVAELVAQERARGVAVVMATHFPTMQLAGPTERLGAAILWGRRTLPVQW